MLAQLLFVLCASNLGTPWGQAGAGWILRTAGEPALHYPASFVFLSYAYARFESVLFALAGSFLIPLSLARIHAPMIGGSPGAGPSALRRALQAYRPTFIGYLVNFALLIAWEYLLQLGPRRWIHAFQGGAVGDLLTWGVGALVAYSIAAIFLYVPIRAVEGATFREAVLGGIAEGVRSLGPTLFIVLVFVWPSLLCLAPVQLRATLLATRFRPELIAILLAVATVLNSFINYFIYSATARYHWLRMRPGGAPLTDRSEETVREVQA
jgi:hypothetical protein